MEEMARAKLIYSERITDPKKQEKWNKNLVRIGNKIEAVAIPIKRKDGKKEEKKEKTQATRISN